jgi:hypothetical protein
LSWFFSGLTEFAGGGMHVPPGPFQHVVTRPTDGDANLAFADPLRLP